MGCNLRPTSVVPMVYHSHVLIGEHQLAQDWVLNRCGVATKFCGQRFGSCCTLQSGPSTIHFGLYDTYCQFQNVRFSCRFLVSSLVHGEHYTCTSYSISNGQIISRQKLTNSMQSDTMCSKCAWNMDVTKAINFLSTNSQGTDQLSWLDD